MDDIELDNFDNRPEEVPEEEEQQEETNIDTAWRDQSVVIIGGFNPVREGLDEEKNADKELGKKFGAIKRSYTEDKKNLLREMHVNINKGDGPFAKTIFEKLKVTVNRKGKVNGAEFDGVRTIVQKGTKLDYTEDVKKGSKVNEFKELVKNAELEHQKTSVALVEDTLDDISVDADLSHSVLQNSIENLESSIDEKVVETETRSVTIDKEKIREFRGITKTADHNLDNGGLKVQEEYFRNLARDEPNELKSRLYEEMADVCVLKADEIRLRRNQRPESKIVQNIVEEEARNNDLTRFERFKGWSKKKNLSGISVVAISVAGIITMIVMGARNAVKRGAKATSKFAKALVKLGKKAAPVIGGLLNITAKLLSLGADAVGFLSKNLWILAVAIAYALYERRKNVNY